MKTFEAFIIKNKVVSSDWQKLINKLLNYENNITIEILFKTNNIEIFLYCKKDLSILANKLEPFILNPVDKMEQRGKEHNGSVKSVRFKLPRMVNILKVKEKEEIKKQRTIYKILVNCKKIFKVNIYSIKIFLRKNNSITYCSSYYSLINPLINFDFNFKDSFKIKKKPIPLYLKLDKVINLFDHNKKNSFLKIYGFPNFPYPLYFSLDKFDFGKHGLLVGQTGVGKSKLIELFIRNMKKQKLLDEYAVVVVDPHAGLHSQFADFKDLVNFDFIKFSCELFPSLSEPKVATELSILLFKTLLKDQFNAKMERVLKYALYVLFLQNKMSLNNLKKLLTELEFRKQLLKSMPEEFTYLLHFFDTEFVELQTKFYEIAIMPILVLVDELNFIPAFSKNVTQYSLESTLEHNSLVFFSLNRIFLGEKATRLIAGLIIQQIFLIAQKRSINKKIILIIDEVSTVENESLINILSEARKFNLSLILSQQYLTQITPELLKGILSNVYNYFIFKVSDEDAKIVTKNLDITFPDNILTENKKMGLSDEYLKRKLIVTLNPRDCLVRVFANNKFYPCFKAKTMSLN